MLVLGLGGALAGAVWTSSPPAPRPADAPPALFSAGRAMADVAAIARAPHPTGSGEDARVRDVLAARLRALGLEVQIQAQPLSPTARATLTRMGAPPPAEARTVNVIGRLAGRDQAGPAVLVMAHHDTVPGSPGAADDSAGVAAILETVRAIKAGPAPRRDLMVLFTDAEEIDSGGAKAFFASHPLARRIGVVVNLEARGGGGRALMFETGPGDGPGMSLFARSVRGPTTLSAAVLVYRALPNGTDFTIPRRQGILGFNIAFLGRPSLYHAPQATPAAIDAGSVQHLGGQTLDLVRALVLAPVLPGHGPDAVFADVFGLGLVIYPPWVGWMLLAAAVGLMGFAAVRSRVGALAVAGGAARAVGYVVVTGAVMQAANLLSGAGPGALYYDRLAAMPRLELQALCIGLAGVALVVAATGRSGTVWGGWLGGCVVALLLAVAIQALAPGAGPVFTWPLLLASLSAAIAAAVDPAFRRLGAAVTVAILAAVGGAWVLGLAHLAFLGVGADMAPAMAVFALLALIMVLPLAHAAIAPRRALLVALILVIAAFGLASWVRFDAPAATTPSYARS